MGIAFYGEGVSCYKCRRNISGITKDEWVLTKQFGCQYCNKSNWPKYYPDYNGQKWIIIKEYWKPCKSWFGLGPIKDYLVEEILRGGSRPESPELEFESLKDAKEYIKILNK